MPSKKPFEPLKYFPDDVHSLWKPRDIEYINTNNQKVPSVTEILSGTIQSDALLYWANSLGFRHIKYADELNRTANIGTSAHAAIERYLKDKLETPDNVSFLSFLLWYNALCMHHTVETIFIEMKMTGLYYGGTCDLLLKIDGVYTLVDFKTSNHITYKYGFQLAAYSELILNLYGIEVNNWIILQLPKKGEPAYNEFFLTKSDPNHKYLMEFLRDGFNQLVVSYYYIKMAEKEFKTICGGN